MNLPKDQIKQSASPRPIASTPVPIQISPHPQATMQAGTAQQQTIVPQAPAQVQVQAQGINQAGMAQVMSQVPHSAPSPHGVTASMPHQSPQPQYYVQTSVAAQQMQGPPPIAPAPGPQTSTTTVSAIHQPLMHHLNPQQLTHQAPSPMTQFSNQVQLIQGNLQAPYLQHVYQNAQGQLLMPIQSPGGMNAPMQPGTLNSLNSPIQVITGKPFQGQIANHMIAGNKAGVLQSGQGAYNPGGNTTTGNQTVLIGQLATGPLAISQPPNILPAQTTGAKPGDIQKVNNMQAFSPLQQGIAWATTPGGIHQPLIHNQPIIFRGTGSGQENLFIQGQPQAMFPPTSGMVTSIAMTGGGQNAKTRLEVPATIQPKISPMRPPILPNMSGAQLRPGASVSTQTAAGQTIAPAQMGTPRAQAPNMFSPKGKMRGKTGGNRASPAIQPNTVQPQMTPVGIGQAVTTPQAVTSSVNSMGPISTVLPVTSQTMITTGPILSTNSNPVHQKFMTNRPAPVAIHPASVGGVRMTKGPPVVTNASVAPIPTIPSTRTLAPLSTQRQTASPLPSQGHQVSAPMTADVSTSSPNGVQAPVTAANAETLTTTQTQAAPITGSVTPMKNSEQNGVNSTPQSGQPAKETSSSLPNGTPQAPLEKAPTSTGPPKAMVKPQVMTHVIEGFVIHEASEPFPVNRSSLLNDLNKTRPANKTAAVLPQGNPALEQDKETTSKCESCGKVEPRSKLKKHKRFCSSACAKKGAVTKRVGPFREEPPSKKLRELDSPGSEPPKVAEVSPNVEADSGEPGVNILRWTVQDVVKFIQNLKGCEDYADDFKLQEIDGQALLLLKADHLMNAMSIKLGPALKICSQIEKLMSSDRDS